MHTDLQTCDLANANLHAPHAKWLLQDVGQMFNPIKHATPHVQGRSWSTRKLAARKAYLLANLDEGLLDFHSIEAIHLDNDALAGLGASVLPCHSTQPAANMFSVFHPLDVAVFHSSPSLGRTL